MKKQKSSAPKKEQKRTIVYASDGNDIDYLRMSIFSVRKYVGDKVQIYVLSENLSECELPGVNIIDPHQLLDQVGFFSSGWNRPWPYATLYRMVIPLIDDFKDLDSVLYLDSDTLIKSKDVEELFCMSTGSYEVLAAKDSNGTWERIEKCVRWDLCLEATARMIQNLWSDRDMRGYTYVNAGVSIWCVKNIIKNGIDWYIQRLKWFWEAETRCKFDYLDQDFINSMMIMGPVVERKFNTFADRCPSDAEVVIKHFIKHTKGKMTQEAEELGFSYEDDTPQKVVVYSSDGNDSARLIMSANSVKKFAGRNVKFYILTELDSYPDFPDATLINPMKELKDVGFFKEGWNRQWPFSCLFRLAIPYLKEFENVDQLLYLDTDTLVKSRKVNMLFDIKSNGYEAHGVQDIEARQWNIENVSKYDLSAEARYEMEKRLWKPRSKDLMGYINSGVLVLHLNELRNNGIDWYTQRLKWFWEAILRAKFHFPDQDFINVMMDVNPCLSVRYNRFAGDAGTNCVIQHFVGGTKKNMRNVAKSLGI